MTEAVAVVSGLDDVAVVLTYPQKHPVPGELVIHERNQLLSLVTELPLHYPLRL